ncbi:hypothetical protein K239x_54800 [Planctomycetes bacterium K23_9]|uniref:Uncharacterized protein n=1 Tax=Stieleria marina TaxID=1930275 RepID=A0A517P250_9BACT|nr:hypothetical protein K239x_54800 [Planctomycetes bacterium K23_9]
MSPACFVFFFAYASITIAAYPVECGLAIVTIVLLNITRRI